MDLPKPDAKMHSATSHGSDLLIIGAGVVGSFYAYHALQRGLKVTLLERHGTPTGATVRNFGQVVPSGLDQDWQRHGRESLRIYREIQSHCDITVRQHGSLYIASNEQECTLIEELRRINAATGYASELWTREQCCERYPHLRADYCQGGLFFPGEVSVNPRQMIHRLHQYLGSFRRFRIHYQTLVQNLESSNSGVIAETSSGERLTASQAILCCGSEFQTLFPAHFQQSEMQLCKLQMLRLRPCPGVTLPGNILTGRSIRRYESFSQCPSWNEIKSNESTTNELVDDPMGRWGIHILFKQDSDGGIILGDSHEYAPASQPDQLDFELKAEINDCMVAEAQRIMGFPHWDIETSWSGIYSQTADPTGVYCKNPMPNVYITTGIGGKGMTSSAGFTKHHLDELLGEIPTSCSGD
ncbi:TIGR03364 family FAD-dependent oxidoreductase [Allorhodopirellula heiligendammensis]|uniref:Bifunctional tRNA (Mnm(5)s(2)U34)-methyltransferase/FAD-dependent cmnm(5)s(2)U34 oxidoreductase n=1 Tax=Allorhodopirellula heiligendammensis TaxID=2714739 RepID=A0A5C6C626_9BACT|nr:TIGR03364 family FAD-dependent oxidoreductase [Allorhodopirellula heiligendammensis]TWU18229.1 bifunctional tRNA (mnm(5)s(2)U34)-methyltransferase/FAD-dependent cmnm(5)s(2)U34 oxidoreductase [Allorhodopirellula heiligendammensis]